MRGGPLPFCEKCLLFRAVLLIIEEETRRTGTRSERKIMDIRLGDILRMKKGHPCGGNEWDVLRIGMDFRLQCRKCGRMIMVPRKLAEKNLRLLTRDGVSYKPAELSVKPQEAENGNSDNSGEANSAE